ncbi:hypothetical protein BJ742DRAFT_284894 [Cladochytrium replicatum]|nr:hypothetical protein BJ742DRAFT_284894 [Cladochytrium replicatum]
MDGHQNVRSSVTVKGAILRDSTNSLTSPGTKLGHMSPELRASHISFATQNTPSSGTNLRYRGSKASWPAQGRGSSSLRSSRSTPPGSSYHHHHRHRSQSRGGCWAFWSFLWVRRVRTPLDDETQPMTPASKSSSEMRASSPPERSRSHQHSSMHQKMGKIEPVTEDV